MYPCPEFFAVTVRRSGRGMKLFSERKKKERKKERKKEVQRKKQKGTDRKKQKETEKNCKRQRLIERNERTSNEDRQAKTDRAWERSGCQCDKVRIVEMRQKCHSQASGFLPFPQISAMMEII